MTARRLVLLTLLGACSSSLAPDPGLEGLAVSKVAPGTVIPGTKIVVTGASFVDEHWGEATLHLVGDASGNDVDVQWPATFIDYSTMKVKVDAGKLDEIGGDVDFHGTARMEFVALSDGNTYASDPINLDLSFRQKLDPTPTGIDDGVHFVNDMIKVDGDGFLLGEDEGSTYAKLTGCFKPDASSTCSPIQATELTLVPAADLSRTSASFPFAPRVAGIKPGTFTGKVTIINRQTGAADAAATPIDVSYTLVTAQVFSVDPPAASLGQYVFVHGGGFVGGEPSALTELEFKGTFNKTGSSPAQVLMTLIPEYVEGPLVRYVLNTDDALGRALDLRTETGHFTGTVTPIVTYGAASVRGVSSPATFDIAPVKQVVYLHFQPAYIEELRDFGMRAVNQQVRDRILQVCRAAYAGVNIDFRVDPITDFALFENVELVGVDPNNMGLFGYDNSPGKDNGNVRLYDKIGGVNAITQEDGYPGYGGVFLRSLMGFSKHPGSFAKSVPGADTTFDKIFDPFRSDRDGSPVTASDLSGGFTAISDGASCPGGSRKEKMQCAVFVLGGLIGGTLAHEIGHSLGLANPFQDGFHNAGDEPNRLMDAGGDRPFLERAELEGQGPGVFCDDEYAYLRDILPSPDPANDVSRPPCF
jgi:hypothetical protein